ncbi:hypothetical protein BY996DRAFT_4577767 [Phakopsora pachyrhizi]|uniref:Glycerophosphocholine acyltransferase 1 n=1 Tax=Phakopsora pachyrhizi TaxID=170000 RepID=A0AAV0AUY0_PHAPC|nr:hypothetical protein BY996DRAFT_4577767 [Phakopsora pachyrhizi]CAH7672705.1 hypothetical protein PPACK8108_LOCUS7529 [Phakopsora pachyrhizi]
MEDLFGDGLPFYDFLVSLDSYLDLFKRQTIEPLRSEWESIIKTRRRKPFESWNIRSSSNDHTNSNISSPSSENFNEPFNQNQHQNSDSRRRLNFNFKQSKTQTEIELREFAERELNELKLKLKLRRERIQRSWNDSKAVSLREKTSFFLGVQNVLVTALLIAFWPEYIPISYTLQAAYYLPLRVYTYRQQSYHYFLFDICYVINGLCLIFIWFLPSSTLLFEACYGLSHGPSAIAIATWRNSLVFHSVEKMTSLFIHIYPALVFTVIRHYYPHSSERYPALLELQSNLSLQRTLIICSTIYFIWQLLYYRYVIVARANKILDLGRPTSFTYMLNSKTGLISKLLRKVRPDRRVKCFMISQYFYTIFTMLPSLIWFYRSKTLSGVFLWLMFSVSVWNGASFYVEVFGRRFEKEMNGLKKELDQLNRETELSSASTNNNITINRSETLNSSSGENVKELIPSSNEEVDDGKSSCTSTITTELSKQD